MILIEIDSEGDLVSLVEVEYRPLAPLIGKLSDIRAGPADVISPVLVLVLELAISLSPSEDQEGEEEDGGPQHCWPVEVDSVTSDHSDSVTV